MDVDTDTRLGPPGWDGYKLDPNTLSEAAFAAGISYRQVDYWDRVGMIRIADPAKGSGTRRVVTDAERAALIDTARALAETESRLKAVRCGDYFRDRLAHHENKSPDDTGEGR